MKTSLICKSFFSVVCLLLFSNTYLHAQEGSNIWLGQLSLHHKNVIRNLVQVTHTQSYSNQPYFFNNTDLYYTQMEDDNAQTDIFLFDLSAGVHKNLTQSLSSEYSPTPIPGQQAMSVIRVNAAGKQELWSLNLQGKPTQHLAATVEPVGYHVWLNEHDALLFVLGEPHTLQRIHTTEKDAVSKVLDDNIGASFSPYKHSDWYLYSRKTEDGHWLKAYNKQSQTMRRVAKLPNNTEYFAMSGSGYAFTSDGKKVYVRQIINEDNKLSPFEKWKPLDIKESACASGVSRIAISPDETMIALVCEA